MQTKAHKVIQKYFQYAAPNKIQKVFASWISQDADMDEKDDALKSIWNNLDISADYSTEQSFIKLMETIPSNTSLQKKHKIPVFHKLLRTAAILILPIISAGITYFIMNKPVTTVSDVSLVECIVPDGEVRTITLPDSSVVTVNSGSVLIYPQHFTNKRDVFLNGEAYFTVARNESQPFVVKTSDMDIEVLGTVFNVSSYSENGNSITTLEEGKVDVRFKNTDKGSVTLRPNEQIIYNRSSGQIETKIVNTENVVAWTQGSLIIQSMSMDEVVKIIERKYAIKVYLNSNDYKNERITLKMINNETVSEFMDVLQYLIPHMKYKLERDKLYIH